MPAPAKSFTVVADSAIDADSPLTETLMEDLRDNDLHLEEWLGKSYVAAVDHDHDGTNSAVVRAGVPVVISEEHAEDTLEFSESAASVWTTKMTVKFYVAVAATYTIYGSYRVHAGIGASGVQARCYIDSVTAVATTTESTDGSYHYDTASGATGSLTVGWHTCEIQLIAIRNGEVSATSAIQGHAIAIR